VALGLCLLVQGRNQPGRAYWRSAGWLPRSPLVLLCLALFTLGPIGTALTNTDAVSIGGTILPGLSNYDAANLVNGQLAAILPFLLARRYLGSEEAQTIVLKVLVGLGLVYSVFVIAEWRLSPFWNEMVYGFRGSAWNQLARGDGWRPQVFLHHGLWTAIFTAMACIATASLWRAMEGDRNRPLVLIALVWMLITMVLSNSFGALLITIVLVPSTLLLPSAMRLLIVVTIAGTVLFYPMLRSADYVPTTAIVETLSTVDAGRAGSLDYRIRNEDILLQRANERPVFGWGGWSRNRVFDESGDDISVTDGRWIIAFGVFGWIGYLGEYGLLTLPLMLLYRRRRQVGSLQASLGIALVLTANLIDLLPNGTLTSLSWLLAGTVLGRVELAARNPIGIPPSTRAEQSAGRRVRPALGLSTSGPRKPPVGGARPVMRGDRHHASG
jgi:hypothetical protein